MWQATDREGALDKKVESRVVPAGRHGIGVETAKGFESLHFRSQEFGMGLKAQDVYKMRVLATSLALTE
jgi:hypothetical protein